jgi:hypothetical protein
MLQLCYSLGYINLKDCPGCRQEIFKAIPAPIPGSDLVTDTEQQKAAGRADRVMGEGAGLQHKEFTPIIHDHGTQKYR